MKKHIGQKSLLFLMVGVMIGRISAETFSVQAVADMPVTHVIYEQNGAHLSPRLLLPDGTTASPFAEALQEDSSGIYAASSLPSSYSLLDDDGRSYITSVKDQGSTGLCWAYSALGACESNIMKKELEIPANWLDEKGELNLSEAALGWYIFTDHKQEGDFTSGDYIEMQKKGVTGGNASIASYALAAGNGVQLDQYAPFSDWNSGYSEYQRYAAYYRMRSSDIIWEATSNSDDVIKQWIMETGAVSASFYSSDSFYENDTSIAYFQSRHDADDADHAILLVGWDDTYSRKNFRPGKRPLNDGAWLVRNSWGDDDTYAGYFWLSYEDTSLCEFARFDMAEANTDEICYQYDGAVSYAGIGADAAANVFTADADGTLCRVMFPCLSGNPDVVDYTISVYRLDKNAVLPEDGELAVTASGTVYYGGYKGVDIPPVSLKKGERFAIVLRLAAGGSSSGKASRIMLPMESEVTNAEIMQRHCLCRKEQSYICSGSGTWMDVTDLAKLPGDDYTYPYANLGNVALKAIVESADQTPNRTQLNQALAYGEPTDTDCQLYQDAYAAALALPSDAPQPCVDNAACNLLAGLEKSGKLVYPYSLYVNCDSTKGDIDENGKVEMQDAYETLLTSSMHYAGGLGTLRPSQVNAADADEDGAVSINDAYYILMYSSMHYAGGNPRWEDILPEK